MTAQEVKQAIDELKAQGMSEEDIAGTFYMMFQDDKITADQLGELVQFVGYKLSDEFLKMSPEDQKLNGWKETDEAQEGDEDDKGKAVEDVSKEDIEAAKEFKNEKDEDDDDSDDDSEDDETRAKKLFGFDDKE